MTTFEKSKPSVAVQEISDLLSEAIPVLTVHPYPLVPSMISDGNGMAGFEYAGCDSDPYTGASKWHTWGLDISIGPVDAGIESNKTYQQLMMALCSQDHEYSIEKILNSNNVFSDTVKGVEWGDLSAGVNQVDQVSQVYGISVTVRILVSFDPSIYEGEL